MAKPFLHLDEQLALLLSRGMEIRDLDRAKRDLTKLNYYRLSGYWHTMREVEPRTGRSLDTFREGTSFELVMALYEFDARLRAAVFNSLSPIELAIRALLGHALGGEHPFAHLDPDRLSALARQPARGRRTETNHDRWLVKYRRALANSREEFVIHHRSRDAELPVWVAVEVMDWGLLSHLFRLASVSARNAVAEQCELTPPQLESWLRALNVLRNHAAHHARMFNRSFDIKPRLPRGEAFDIVRDVTNRAFGQLTLIRQLDSVLTLHASDSLIEVLESYPDQDLVPFDRIGAPQGWRECTLWRTR